MHARDRGKQHTHLRSRTRCHWLLRAVNGRAWLRVFSIQHITWTRWPPIFGSNAVTANIAIAGIANPAPLRHSLADGRREQTHGRHT